MDELRELYARVRELERRISFAQLIGTIESVSATQPRARVRIGDMLSAPLPWLVRRAGPDAESWTPEPGEQVVVSASGGRMESGIILGSLYQDNFPAPSISPDLRKVTFADGTSVEYDRANHRFDLTLPASTAEVRILSGGRVTVAADGDVSISAAAVAVLEGVAATLLGAGDATDPVARKSDLAAMASQFNAHDHGGPPPTASMSVPSCSTNVKAI